MNYSQDEFLDIMSQVDREGGDHLDKVCKHRRYTFSGPKQKPVILPGCGNSTLFEIPYDLEPATNVLEKGKIGVCAVDDAMGAWPRYGANEHSPATGGWLPDMEELR
jgi:hypothetical protein